MWYSRRPFIGQTFSLLSTLRHYQTFPVFPYLFVGVDSGSGWERAKYSPIPGEWVTSCTEFTLQENASLILLLATINSHTLKCCQGSRGSLISILSEGNVCYRGLDLPQVLCTPQVQISLCLVTCSFSRSKEHQNLLVKEYYSSIVTKSRGICMEISGRLYFVSWIDIWESLSTPVWKESCGKEKRKWNLSQTSELSDHFVLQNNLQLERSHHDMKDSWHSATVVLLGTGAEERV